jgi:DNA repair exonuclease SbcCD ATPase subunit
MNKSCFAWATAFLTVAFLCLARPPVHAADGPGSKTLKKHGLKIVGLLAVVEEEAEIKTKLSDARRLSKQLHYSLMQQQATLSPKELQQNIKNVTDQINQLRSEMTAANQQLNSIPRYRGRFMSNDASQLFGQLTGYRTQLQMEIEQDSLFLNQLKSQPADPKAKEKIDSEVQDRRDAYHQALLDLRKLVDTAHEKYEGLSKDDQVKKALEIEGHGLREKPKLGPSRDFLNNVKLLEKLETAESGGETESSHAKPSKRIGHGTKTKNSSKAAATGSDASGDSGVSP